MPIISIIIPVYKVELYLRRCIDSILAQTFKDFECILVEDGSPDNCPAICVEYAKRDDRIVVIHQENEGVSAARNRGLDQSRGKWITFVDSDDWCEPEMLQKLYENATKYQADISICGVRRVDKNGESIGYRKKNEEIVINGTQAILRMFAGNSFDTSTVTKLVNSKYFLNDNVRFDKNVHYSEDALLYYTLFKLANRITYLSRPYYNYFANPDSITRKGSLNEKIKTCFDAYDKMLLIEKNKKLRTRILARMVIEAYFKLVDYIEEKNFTSESYNYLRRIIYNNLVYLLSDFGISLKYKLSCFLILYPRLFYELYGIYKKIKIIVK